MSRWTRWREERRRRKNQKAYDRLHGRNARPAPGRRSSSSRSSRRDYDLGDLVEDIVLAIPRFVVWVFKSIFD